MRNPAVVFLSVALLICLGACKSEKISLDGEWQLCRTQTGDMPDDKAVWTPVKVPAFLNQMDDKPFMWYRRPLLLPSEAKGKHIFLRFGGVRFVSEVYLNGKKVGGHYGGWEPFEIDITGSVRFDKPNALLVRVQDVTGVIEQKMDYSKQGKGVRFISQAKDSVMAPVGSQYMRVGIWQPVELIFRNDVYVEDVFIKTSVRKKEIEAVLTLRNLRDKERNVQVASYVAEMNMAVGKADIRIPARSTATVTLKHGWGNPRLWGPEDPFLYHLVTKVSEGSTILDVVDTRFGFREFWAEGMHLILNGTRMKFLATAGHPLGELDKELSKEGAKDFYARIREAGCVAMRLHANVWPEWWYEAADEVGMPIIMESALFCFVDEYALSKPKFWENYRKHLEAIIKHKRNHPAIVMYSLENEILHCGGERVKETMHQLAEAGRFVKALDPTRPIMYDADHDPEGVADVVNLHYPLDFNKRNLWPDVGYWLETGMELASWPRTFWKWDRKKPLYFGEFLHIQHYNETDPYSVLIGDEAYEDHDLAMAKTKALAWSMQIEAYRATDVSGMCPWTLTESGPFPSDKNLRYLAVKRAYQKNAAFIREYDSRFYENEKVDRTVYIYNDTLHPAKLTFVWQLKKGEALVEAGQKEFDTQPAEKRELKISLRMPPAQERTALRLELKVYNGTQLAFEESKTYWVFPKRRLSLPAGRTVALFEGADKTLSAAFPQAIRVSDLAKLPQTDILIIGPHALDSFASHSNNAVVVGEGAGPAAALHAFVRSGGTAIVLEQDSYSAGLIPAELVDRGCTIAFQRARDEILFKGLLQDDFKFWRNGHVVCRKTIMKPRSGRFRPLVDSGGPRGLVYLPLCEIMEGKGRYILSQFMLSEKLGKEPVAQIILENILAYAAIPCAPASKLAVVQDKTRIRETLNELDAVFTDLSGKLVRTDLKDFAVLLAETDCAEVGQNQAKLRAFVENGGRIVLHRGTRDGFRRVQALFPEPIFAQRSNAIPVNIAQWDTTINGLTNQELYWYGSRKGLHWVERTPLSPDVCRYVIAAGLPDTKDCVTIEAESMKVHEGSPKFNKEDVYMWARASLKARLHFRRSGDYAFAIRGKGTPLAGVYPQIRISIDGTTRGSITTDGEEWDTYSIVASVEKGDHEVELTFVNDAWDPEKGEDRNVWLDKLTYGPMPPLKSQRLLRPAALVKVPLGKGFYLLDQVQWSDPKGTSETAERYISNLLTNLGCDFGGRAGAVVIPADKFNPEGELKVFKGEHGVLSLGTNGTVSAVVRFATTRKYQFAVRASGTEAAGQFPNVALSIDGKTIADRFLSKPDWQTLRFEAEVSQGDHKVGLSFTNDYYNPPEDRNLKIEHLEIK